VSEEKYVRYNVTPVKSDNLEWKYKRKRFKYVKIYNHILPILAGMDGCARNLIEYLITIMSKDNVVSSNKNTRDEFNGFMTKHAKVTYQDITMKTAFSILRQKDILIPIKRGSFMINPEYYCIVEESDRTLLMRKSLERKFEISYEPDDMI